MEAPMLLPLLPRGEPLFEGLPGAAVVLDQLPAAVRDGAITVMEDGAAGVLLVRAARPAGASWQRGAERLTGGDAARRLGDAGPRATVSAFRLDQGIVEALSPVLLGGDPCHRGLSLTWTDWHGLIADLLSRRDATYLAELRTPAGHGVTIIAAGERVATYTEAHPAPGDHDLLDELARQPSGSVSVWRAVARPETTGPEADEAPPLQQLLPELKLVARRRLHLSAERLERALDQAAAASLPLDSVLEEIRAMSIRGVLPSTLEQLSLDMRALAASRVGAMPSATARAS